MKVPPRNCKVDRLTSFTMLFYAYGQGGVILTAGCLFVYFRTFWRYGVSAEDLFGMNNNFFPSADGVTEFLATDGSFRRYGAKEQVCFCLIEY